MSRSRARGAGAVRGAQLGPSIALVAVALVGLVASARAAPARAKAAKPAVPALSLVGLAPAEDARRAVPIGPGGEVYEPDGKGAWVRHQAITTADKLSVVGRAGAGTGPVVALGDGVVYRLAANGWSALRLVQKGGALMSSGPRAVAAVGRQLFALDHTVAGEPAKLALAPTPVLGIGSGARGLVIATERGLLDVKGAKLTPLKRAPRKVNRLVTDAWAVVDRGVVDLRTGTIVPWPAGLAIAVVAPAAGDGVIAVGATRGGLELVTITGGKVAKVERQAIVAIDTTVEIPGAAPAAAPVSGTAVGVMVDKAGRAVVALRDGRIVLRDGSTWTLTAVREELPADKPGSPPATVP